MRPMMIGEDFDDLWQRISGRGNMLLAYRSSEFLKWHFSKPGNHPEPEILGCYNGDKLIGYIALVRQDNDWLRLRRTRIADLFVERHDPEVTLALLDSALTATKEGGSCMLEITGFPSNIRRCVSAARPYRLTIDHNPFWYRPISPLADGLDVESVWYGSLFDGDGSV